jgi:deoxyribodipyrimidine photo-lyase
MYVASICCNIAQSHWLECAKWMYAHLYDGDAASNQLSRQWVAGEFSNKKYYANQNNINKFFSSTQKNTFLDIEYEGFESLQTPEILLETTPLAVDYSLPKGVQATALDNRETLIYNYYNLDASWYNGEDIQRILLLEPSVFRKHPVNSKSIEFALELAKNISNMQLFVGKFDDIIGHVDLENIIYKEHPLNAHYRGTVESREWLTDVTGYFPSFFGFWKKAKKQLQW